MEEKPYTPFEEAQMVYNRIMWRAGRPGIGIPRLGYCDLDIKLICEFYGLSSDLDNTTMLDVVGHLDDQTIETAPQQPGDKY